jgi:hypothetical protein
MRFVILLFFVLVSCSGGRKINFVVHNLSQDVIDSVVVITSTNNSRVVINDIQPGSSEKKFLEMSKEPYVDGDYHVSIVAGSRTYSNRIGYFTNGAPVEEKMEIWFSMDTIRYEPKPKRKYQP